MKHSLVEDLVEAAERGDHAGFDRIFDVSFALVYSLAFQRAAGDQESAEQMTRRALEQSVRHALDARGVQGGAAAESTTSQARESAA
jgi:hypothetical protein